MPRHPPLRLSCVDSKARVMFSLCDGTPGDCGHSGVRNVSKTKVRQGKCYQHPPDPKRMGSREIRSHKEHLSHPKDNFTNRTKRVTGSKTESKAHTPTSQVLRLFLHIRCRRGQAACPQRRHHVSLLLPTRHFPIPLNTDFPSHYVHGVPQNPTHEKRGKGGVG